MTRTKNILKKGLSLLICTALIVCALPFAFSTEVSAQDSAYIRIADPSTMDDWKNIFSHDNPTTEYAGGIWTDKSVFTDDSAFGGKVTMQDENNNFLVALSAIGSDISITGYSQVPTDTIFVIDVSRSMGENVQSGDNNNNAVDELITATNKAIDRLMAENNYNRVGIVLYSGTYSPDVKADASNAMVMLPLSRYEQAQGAYLEKDNQLFEVGETMRSAESIKVNDDVTSGGNAVEIKEREVFGGTFTQSGVYAALSEFLQIEDTEIYGEHFQSGTKRLPVMVLMSDGVATSASTNYMGAEGSIGTSDMGNGTTPEDELATAIPFVTQLTCSYAKNLISEHYGRESLFYTLGYNVKSTPVLDPDNTTADIHWQTYDATETGSYMQLAVKSSWVSSGWWGEGHWDTEYKPVLKSEYNLNKNYADKYFCTKNDLQGTFDAITEEIISNSLLYPTQVSNGNINHDGYVEFIDDIGQFMEVKKVHGILLGNVLFTGDNIASNFIGGGGNLGTIDKPSHLGDEMIRSVKARLGIAETAKAQELVRAAYQAKQLYYDAETGEWSNYIGWYADAEGNFLGHGTRDDKTPLEGAVFYNESYGYLGQVYDGNKTSDMMYVSVQVHTRIATGTSAVIFRIPASLLPVISYNVTLTGDSLKDPGEITLKVNDVMNKDTDNDGVYDEEIHEAPMRLVFEVGLKDGINELNVAEVAGENYKYRNGGNYDFYVSRWNNEDINHKNPSVAENTVSFFTPSTDNGRYYYEENAVVYKKVGDEYVPYTGSTNPGDTRETLYREFGVFEKMTDSDTNNARLHLHYEEISAQALASAKAADKEVTDNTTWYIPKGTVHRMYRDYHKGKGGFADDEKTQVNANNTGTVIYSHYLGVELTTDENGNTSYYADVVHGNNGKLSIKQAQGVRISAEADITLQGGVNVFGFELSTEDVADDVALRLVKEAAGSRTEEVVHFTSGKMNVELASDEAAYLIDLPAGAQVNVKEIDSSNDYRVKSVNGEDKSEVSITVTDCAIAEAHFVNTMEFPEDSANLVLQNLVTHPFGENYEIPENIVFEYTVEYASEDGAITRETYTLAPSEVKIIKAIPLGAEVVITEKAPNSGFVCEHNTAVTFTASKEDNYVIKCHSVYTPESISPDVTVDGVAYLEGRDWLHTDKFEFVLQKFAGSQWGNMTCTTPDGEVVTAAAQATKDNHYFDLSAALQAEIYSEVGVYSYRAIEVFDTASNQGVTYDKSVRWFDIVVTDNDMDGKLELSDVVPYVGTTADKNTQTGVWNVKTAFTNSYSAQGSDTVTIRVQNKFVNSQTMLEDETVTKAGYEFGLYQNNRLVTILPATNIQGETFVTLTYGTLDIGKHIHYQLKATPSDSEGAQYITQIYNIAVDVYDDAQGGVKAQVTVTEDTQSAESVTAREVMAEFVNVVESEEVVIPPTDDPADNPEEQPTIPEPSDTPESSTDENKDSGIDAPDTGFVAVLNNSMWIAFIVLMVVALAGVIFTSKRK